MTLPEDWIRNYEAYALHWEEKHGVEEEDTPPTRETGTPPTRETGTPQDYESNLDLFDATNPVFITHQMIDVILTKSNSLFLSFENYSMQWIRHNEIPSLIKHLKSHKKSNVAQHNLQLLQSALENRVQLTTEDKPKKCSIL